ncbi:hypothetical protein N7G274_000568 [Stereocaulon virgatum]|uniref:Uncharacterized protein n=1 Tax=Stereocaulon virgatum TaxID=373712 RepID=A0ABR4ASW1_9LECA
MAQEAKTIDSKSKDAGNRARGDGEGICARRSVHLDRFMGTTARVNNNRLRTKVLASESQEVGRESENFADDQCGRHLVRLQVGSYLRGICLSEPTDVDASQRYVDANWCYLNLLRVGSKLKESIQSEFDNEGTGSDGVTHDRYARCLALLRAGPKLEQNLLSELKDLDEGSKKGAGDRYARYLVFLSFEFANIDRSDNIYVASVPLQAETIGSGAKDAVKKDLEDALRHYFNLRVRRGHLGEISERGGAKNMKQSREEELADSRAEDTIAEDSSDEDEAADGYYMIGLPSDLYSVRKAPELGTYPTDEMVEVTFKQPRGYQQRRLSIYDYEAISVYPELYEYIYHDVLQCRTPEVLSTLLLQQLGSPVDGVKRILTISSHDGRVGRQLRSYMGMNLHLTGLESSFEAHATVSEETSAAYNEIYIPIDLADSSSPAVQDFMDNTDGFRAVVICEALGPNLGEVPLEVFDNALPLVVKGGHMIIVVDKKHMEGHAAFLASTDLKVVEQMVYRHRLNVWDEWICYCAIVLEKL